MKIEKEIIKNIYPDVRKRSVKLYQTLGIASLGNDEYLINDINSFIKNFWSKLNDEQKANLFLTQVLEHENVLDELKNRMRWIEDRLDNLKITYSY
jgi:hypothetical protein